MIQTRTETVQTRIKTDGFGSILEPKPKWFNLDPWFWKTRIDSFGIVIRSTKAPS